MAETSVLSISLKEYKKSIEDLRSSLLGLENGSEEYNKIVEEIRERQQTLNDVMRAGKAEYDSNANSLNGMKARLSELKKEFGDLEVGTEKWKQAQSEIESLNEDIGKIEEGMHEEDIHRIVSKERQQMRYPRDAGEYLPAEPA